MFSQPREVHSCLQIYFGEKSCPATGLLNSHNSNQIDRVAIKLQTNHATSKQWQ
jgi:hypothetical protein